MSYHLKKIEKGKLGELSKIQEEWEEFQDGVVQESPILILCELADLIGAIEAYTLNKYNITLDQVIKMKKATKKAFELGSRK
jgi:phosphoribosyl-ATP pyrophosphohydrolase